jgi:outer membrane protein OmpA-like peptidoglycan-associated protein
VTRYAPVELEQARQALARAETVNAAHPGSPQVDHLAYLAAREAEIAQARAAQRVAEDRIAAASTEREQMLLAASRREVEQARLQAHQAEQAAAQAQQRARDLVLEQQMRELQAKENEGGLVVTLRDTMFDPQGALRPEAQSVLGPVARLLRDDPERRVRIEGFSDDQGSVELSRRLSVRRAMSVRDALVNLGVPAERVEVRGLGAALPLASNATDIGREMNRRVEILLSDPRGRLDAGAS